MRYTMHNVSMDNLPNNYIVNIIDYVLCFTTNHFLYEQVTITQTVSPFSSTTCIYNFEIACYIMILAILEIIYIYQSYRTYMEFIILICIFYYYALSNRAKIIINAYRLYSNVDHTKNACCISAQYLPSYICIYICLLSKVYFYTFQNNLYIRAQQNAVSNIIITNTHKLFSLWNVCNW